MGKPGEKQKRRPKLKDKKQSERFKEAARQLGADKPSENFDRVLESLSKITPVVPKTPQIPTDTQLVGINRGGIAELANGTYWRIAPVGDLSRARKWAAGTQVILAINDPAKTAWKFKLTNAETGENVGVIPSTCPPK